MDKSIRKLNLSLLIACALLATAAGWGTFHGIRHDFIIPASAIGLEKDKSYTATPPPAPWPFASLSDGPGRPDRSNAELFENGRPLGPAHSLHEDIRNEGLGRFSHWGPILYFSASDNSDPRVNGREYKISTTAVLPLWLSALMAFFFAISLHFNREFLLGLIHALSGKLAAFAAGSRGFGPVLLLLVAIVVRVPYFFYSVVDWDESSYILMGADVLQGHLPYVSLWANQPPLVYFHYALFLLAFGKSIVAVRLAGFLCVYISALLLYRLAKKIDATPAAFWLAALQIIFASSFDGQATMSEHLIQIPLILSLQLFLLAPPTAMNSAILGLLSGFMTLTRSNMAFFALALGLLLVLPGIRRDRKSSWLRAAAFAAGSLAPVGVVSLLYWAAGNFSVLYQSFFLAPFAFVSGSSEALPSKAASFLRMFFDRMFFPAGLSLLSLSAIGVALTLYRRKRAAPGLRKLACLPLLALPILFSIILWGTGYEHYLMLVFPILILASAPALSFLLQSRLRKAVLIALALTLLEAISGPAKEWRRLGQELLSGHALFADTGYLIADDLNRRQISGRYVYFLEYHIGYFLTGAAIPARYAHPAAICRESYVHAVDGARATPETVLQEILEKKPALIIRRERVWYFDELCPKNNDVLQRELDRNYEMEAKVGDAYIYRRKIAGLPAT